MRKYRNLSLFLVIIVMLFSGCGAQKVSSGSSIRDNSIPKKTSNIVVGFSQVGSESDWRRANTMSYKNTFTEENGFYLLYEDAQQKQENQLKAVRNFILQRVDYIILDPIVETGWDEVLQEAKKANIPVILVDRQADVSPDLYTCWIGSNFYQEGLNAGAWLEKYLVKAGRAEEDINIVSLQGTIGSTAQIGRTKGFKEVMAKHSNWHLLEETPADFTQAKGKEVMAEYLKKYPKIDILLSENDNMSFGAVEAIKAVGQTCGSKGDIKIISYDAVLPALNTLYNGDFNVVFECNTQLGQVAADIINKLRRGEKVEKTIYVDETYFDDTMDLETIINERRKLYE